MPARDIGAPYLARFSAVSGTGPLETTPASPALSAALSPSAEDDAGRVAAGGFTDDSAEPMLSASVEELTDMDGLESPAPVEAPGAEAGAMDSVGAAVSALDMLESTLDESAGACVDVAGELEVWPLELLVWATATPHNRADAAAAVRRVVVMFMTVLEDKARHRRAGRASAGREPS